MKAYKCDRCGALYEQDWGITGRYYITRNPMCVNCLDLCPKCDKELQAWFNEFVEEEGEEEE